MSLNYWHMKNLPLFFPAFFFFSFIMVPSERGRLSSGVVLDLPNEALDLLLTALDPVWVPSHHGLPAELGQAPELLHLLTAAVFDGVPKREKKKKNERQVYSEVNNYRDSEAISRC